MKTYKYIIAAIAIIAGAVVLLSLVMGTTDSFIALTEVFGDEQFITVPYFFGNLITGVAYFALSLKVILYRRQRGRKEKLFYDLTYLFSGFLLFAGVSHSLKLTNLWTGLYIIDAYWSLLTSLLIAVTAFLIYTKWKTIISLPTVEELEKAYRVGLAQTEVFLDAFIVHNGKEILYANEGFTRIFGWTIEEAVGSFYDKLKLFPIDQEDRIAEKVEKKIWGVYTSSALTKSGDRLEVIINAKRMYWEGQDARAITFRDITEEVRVREQLNNIQKRSNDRETIRQIKDKILSSLKHYEKNGNSTGD